MRRYNGIEIYTANQLLFKIAKIAFGKEWPSHEQACIEGINEIIKALKTPNEKKDCINLFSVSYIDLLRISALLNKGKVPVSASRTDNVAAFCVEKIEGIKRRMYG